MLKYNTVKNKFFLSFLLTLMLPLLIFSIVSFSIVSSNVKEYTDSYYMNILQQVQKNMYDQLNEVASIALRYSNTTWINEIMMIQDSSMKGRVSTWELYTYNQELITCNTISSAIDEIGIVFKGKDITVSSIRLSSLDSFLKNTFQVQGLSNFIMEDAWQNFYVQKIFYDIDLLSENNYSRKGILIVNSLPVDAYKDRVRATMLTFIDYNNIRNRIEKICLEEEVGVFLINDNDEVLVDYNVSNVDIGKIIRLIKNREEEDGIIKANNFSENIYSIEIPKYGWRIIAVVPNSIFLKNAYQIFLLLFASLIFVITIGIILSRYLAGNRYRPLKLLMEKLCTENDTKIVAEGLNEYDYINKKIHEIIQQEKELKVRIEQQKPVLYDKYIESLILNSEELCEDDIRKMSMAGINLSFEKFCVAVVFINQINDINEFTNKMKTVSAKNMIHLYWCTIRNSLVILFNYNRDEAMADFWNVIENDMTITARFGIGNTVNDVRHVSRSYAEAIEANDYRTIENTTKTMFYKNISRKNSFYYYPFEIEVNFADTLLSGDYVKIVSIIDNLILNNQSYNSISLMALNNFFANLELTILKVVHSAQLKTEVKRNKSLTDSACSIMEKRESILDVCRAICLEIAERQTESNNQIWCEVIEYIDSNYMNNNLTLGKVAEKFNYNVSTFSSKFKEYKGVSFTHYLNGKRINHACILIQQGMQFSEAAKKVGYNSEDTFRRVFKKYKCMTPSSYASIHCKQGT